MALLDKPIMEEVWASGGSAVKPSDEKIQTGWTAEVPPYQYENWIQGRQDQYLAHVNQRGIPQWDGLTEYEGDGLSYTQGTDGVVYKSVGSSGPSGIVQDPTTDVGNTYWEKAFADNGDSRIVNAVPNTRQVVAGTGLLGGGGLTTNRTLSVDFATEQEHIAGQSTELAANPAGVAAMISTSLAPDATEEQRGLITLATTEQAQELTAGDVAVTPNTLGAAMNAHVLGMGQTWQDVLDSRDNQTNYTNTTGRAIFAYIRFTAQGSSTINDAILVDGIPVGFASSTTAGMSNSIIIPPGSVYRVNTNRTVETWTELR